MFDGTFRVTLGGFRFFDVDDNGCEWIATMVDSAWNAAGTTHAHSTKAFGSGWFANRSERLGRSLTVEGSVVAPSYDAFLASRQLMLSSVPLESGTLTIDFQGVARQYTVRQDSGEVLLTHVGGLVWSFSIPLVSLSPYSFDVGAGVSGSTGLPESDGGLGYPYAFTGGSRRFAALTAQWTGTPNASPSRLLDGAGNVIATNLATDPNVQRVFNFWQASGMLTADGMQCTINEGNAQGSVYPLSSSGTNSLPAGSYVEVVHIDNVAGVGSIGTDQMVGADNAQVQYSNGVAVVRFDSQGSAQPNRLYVLLNPSGGCLLRRTGLYTAADWQAMQEAGVTWFDGDYTRDAYGSYAFTETATSGGVSLLNPGAAPSPVTLRVDGPATNPRIEHMQSGAILELAMSLGAGHYVTFDGSTRQILIDGRDPARGIVTRRGWSDALPGENTWEFSAAGHTDDAKLSVSFRGAYL